MNRPKDIPEDVWEKFRTCITNDFTTSVPGATVTKRVEFLIRVCRAAMAYGQRRADEAREKAAQAIEDHEIWHWSEGDGLRQRSEGNRSGLACVAFIRSQK